MTGSVTLEQAREAAVLAKLKWNNYYVVEVEVFKGNVRHKAIVRVTEAGSRLTVAFISGWPNVIKKQVRHCHYFKVISHIEMT